MNLTERRIRRSSAGRKILGAVRIAQRSGFTIVAGGDANMTGEDKCCCPLQTLRPNARIGDFVAAADAGLGWPNAKAWIFAMGFDGIKVSYARYSLLKEGECSRAEFSRHRGTFELGRLFRRLLIGGSR